MEVQNPENFQKMKSDFSMASILLENDKQKEKESIIKKHPLPCRLENLKEREWLERNKSVNNDAFNLQNKNSIIKTNLYPDGERTNKVKVKLDDFELWKSFHRLTNEMIVTKNGR